MLKYVVPRTSRIYKTKGGSKKKKKRTLEQNIICKICKRRVSRRGVYRKDLTCNTESRRLTIRIKGEVNCTFGAATLGLPD